MEIYNIHRKVAVEAACRILRDVSRSAFNDLTCEGILLGGESKEEAALAWMQENYDPLFAVLDAVYNLLATATDYE